MCRGGPVAARLGDGRDGGSDEPGTLILGVVAVAQLMVILDLTVMNIALPSAQRALHFTVVDRQWVVTAYALAFGSTYPARRKCQTSR